MTKSASRAVTRALNPVTKNAERITKELRLLCEELNLDGIEFPTPWSERMFKKFKNNYNISLVVFGHDNDDHNYARIILLYVP